MGLLFILFTDFSYRKYVIAGAAMLIVVVYILRLFALQVVSEDYRKSADSNAFLNRCPCRFSRPDSYY